LLWVLSVCGFCGIGCFFFFFFSLFLVFFFFVFFFFFFCFCGFVCVGLSFFFLFCFGGCTPPRMTRSSIWPFWMFVPGTFSSFFFHTTSKSTSRLPTPCSFSFLCPRDSPTLLRLVPACCAVRFNSIADLYEPPPPPRPFGHTPGYSNPGLSSLSRR